MNLNVEEYYSILKNNDFHKLQGIKLAVKDKMENKPKRLYWIMRVGGYHDACIISYLSTYDFLSS